MNQNKQNNVLVIGGPNAGKTHFGGQLYGRLMDRSGLYSITTAPDDLTIFREVLDCLNEGRSAGHTSVNANTRLELALQDSQKNQIIFSFPDYGGEQVIKLVTQRKINETWQKDIENCGAWMLFIRLDEISPIEDVINRGIPDEKILKSRQSDEVAFKLTETAYFVDLLQILLNIKRASLHQQITIPRLTVVLSCWDLLPDEERLLKPEDVLMNRLPLLYNFIETTWLAKSFSIIGLSSTGKTLSATVGDKDYIKRGPEDFGYVIDEQGQEVKDLTISIATAIGK